MSIPAIYQPAPTIEIGEWISGRPEEENGFSGKNVILEFWGTRCGPCIAAICHLNELVDTYGSDETLFVSLTNEEPGIVQRFLEKRPIKGAVAVDRDGATFKAYGIRGIPHTFLIDSRGLLRWYGHPNSFTAELLDTFLRTGKTPAVVPQSSAPETVPVTTPDTLFLLKIDRSSSGKRGAGWGGNDEKFEAEFYGQQVVDVIRTLLDHPKTRMRLEGRPPEDLLDIELYAFHPLKAATAKQRVIDVLCDTFGITISRVLELQEGWKLTCPQPRLTDMSELGGSMSVQTSKDELTASNITLDGLVGSLEKSVGQILFNDTHLGGKYDFTLPTETFERTRQALEEEYGIKVEPESREIEMVILSFRDASIS